MTVFEYPYILIIFSALFLAMILIGVYFTMKSVKAVSGTAEKDFCTIEKAEAKYAESEAMGKYRTIIYISIVLDAMKRMHSEAVAASMYDRVKSALFKCLCLDIDGGLSLCGNENFIAVNSLEPNEAQACIERCFEKVNEIFIEYGAVNIGRIHFGYVCTRSNDVAFKTVLERSKKALSIAESKDVLYYRWDSLSEREFEKKLKIENSIQNEIENNRFFLEYQPVLEAGTGRIIGAEVLSRLNSPTEGILSPRHFISAVNNAGLNKKFDYYIFEKQCMWISNDRENRGKYVYTINFSRYTLCDKNMVDNIKAIIEKYGVDCACIAIEVLEDKSLNGDERAETVKNLNSLAEKGISVFLDDFGKGYTDFDDLRDFDISVVKIDKTITQNAVTEKGFLILENIIRIAHDLGSKALCEGIETEEQKKAASDAGCDMLQGYYLFKPLTVAGLEKLLEI